MPVARGAPADTADPADEGRGGSGGGPADIGGTGRGGTGEEGGGVCMTGAPPPAANAAVAKLAHRCCPGEEAVWGRPRPPAVVLLVESCLNLVKWITGITFEIIVEGSTGHIGYSNRARNNG